MRPPCPLPIVARDGPWRFSTVRRCDSMRSCAASSDQFAHGGRIYYSSCCRQLEGVDGQRGLVAGAEGGIRTSTGLLQLAPEASASAVPPLPQVVRISPGRNDQYIAQHVSRRSADHACRTGALSARYNRRHGQDADSPSCSRCSASRSRVARGFVLLYLLVGREPAVPANAVLTLTARRRTGRDRPRRRRRPICAAPARRPSAASSRPAKGQGRRAHHAVLLKAHRVHDAVLGEGAGDPRRGHRLPQVGQAGVRLSRIRRRSRLLPGDRGRQGLPDAVEHAGSDRRRDLRVFLRGTLDKIGVVPGPPPHRRLQDRRRTPSPRRATRPRTARWTRR